MYCLEVVQYAHILVLSCWLDGGGVRLLLGCGLSLVFVLGRGLHLPYRTGSHIDLGEVGEEGVPRGDNICRCRVWGDRDCFCVGVLEL